MRCAVYDPSAQYLAVGGSDVRVYTAKGDWGLVKTFADLPRKGVCSLAWGTGSRGLLAGGGDHNLRVFSAPE